MNTLFTCKAVQGRCAHKLHSSPVTVLLGTNHPEPVPLPLTFSTEGCMGPTDGELIGVINMWR